MSTDAGAPVDRRARRKAQTRGKLLDAARAVFARQGIDATRINDITDEADVGFGSFYNHFDSKDAIVAAVVEETVRAVGESIDALTAETEDVAEVVAVAHRLLLARVAQDPELGWLLVRLEITHGLASAALGPFAVRDIERGRDSGRFVVEDLAFTLAATGGALLGVVRAVLAGQVAADVGERHAAAVLRILGLPARQAAAVASRPLPTLKE